MLLSARQEVVIPDDENAQPNEESLGRSRVPAIEWMLDVVTDRPIAEDYRVFRIENLEVLDMLDLEPRPGSFRYSFSEVMSDDKRETIGKQLELLRSVDPDERSVFQTKIGELGSKLVAYQSLRQAFAPLRIGADANKILEDIQIELLSMIRLQADVRFGRTKQQQPRIVAPSTAGRRMADAS